MITNTNSLMSIINIHNNNNNNIQNNSNIFLHNNINLTNIFNNHIPHINNLINNNILNNTLTIINKLISNIFINNNIIQDKILHPTNSSRIKTKVIYSIIFKNLSFKNIVYSSSASFINPVLNCQVTEIIEIDNYNS